MLLISYFYNKLIRSLRKHRGKSAEESRLFTSDFNFLLFFCFEIVPLCIETLKNKQKIRCAIYTRKSSEEGLEQEFNSLDAQRLATESYISSQQLQEISLYIRYIQKVDKKKAPEKRLV